jgi:predicted GNAT superfamily acetyltransferase
VVEVPREIDEIKSRDMDEAKRWQQEVRTSFQKHLAEGLYCASFIPGRNGANSRYLFYKDTFAEGRLSYDQV